MIPWVLKRYRSSKALNGRQNEIANNLYEKPKILVVRTREKRSVIVANDTITHQIQEIDCIILELTERNARFI